MPSPFPGMDPFLEDPAGWPDVHSSLISSVRELLVPQLEPDYVIRIEERVYITDELGDAGYPRLVPDVLITAVPRRDAATASARTATIAPSLYFEELTDPEIHDRFLVIRDRRDRRVVTAIEILSPANKVSSSFGREAMDSKRRLFLEGGANWLEIDLLRAGERSLRWAGRSDYCVTLKRANRPGNFVWLVTLREPLPTVAVPLDAGREDVSLDLQHALTLSYDRAGYRRSIDYDDPVPLPRLSDDDEAWVRDRITAWRGQSS